MNVSIPNKSVSINCAITGSFLPSTRFASHTSTHSASSFLSPSQVAHTLSIRHKKPPGNPIQEALFQSFVFFAKKEREKRWNRTMIYILLQPVDTFALFFEPAPFYYPSYHHRHCPLAVDCRSSKRSFSSKTKTQNHTARRSRKHIRVKAKTRKRTQKRQRK